MGALGGSVMQLCFGYLEQLSSTPRSCFWVLLSAIVLSLGWLHATVRQLQPQRVMGADVPEASAATQ